MEPAEHRDRGVAADGGEHADVLVAERLGFFPGEAAQDVLRGAHPHLLRRRRDPRDRGRMPGQRGEIADHHHLGMSRNGEIFAHHDAAGAVERHPEARAERRGGHARRPYRGARGEAVGAHLHALAVDSRDQAAQPHRHAEALELPPRAFREPGRIARQDALAAFDQHHARVARVEAPELAAQRMAR